MRAVPIAAAVLTLDPSAAPRVLAGLAADPRLLLGPAQGTRVPIVVDTPTAAEGVALVEALLGIEGVVAFDVVSVELLEEEHEEEERERAC